MTLPHIVDNSLAFVSYCTGSLQYRYALDENDLSVMYARYWGITYGHIGSSFFKILMYSEVAAFCIITRICANFP
jgi:hypothetical protein